MYSESAQGADHAGFSRTVDTAAGTGRLRVSLVVVATLAMAIVASAAALRLDDPDVAPGGHGLSAAWNVGHPVPFSGSRGG